MASKPVILNAKGQLIIPSEVRKRLGWKSGTRMVVLEENGRAVIQPFPEFLSSLVGCLKNKKDKKDPMKVLLKERKRDRFL